MASAPIILVPGFWLGAWAWDEVAGPAPRRRPRRRPRSPSPAWSRPTPTARRSRFKDHVDAIADAVEAADEPVVLAVHSATGLRGLRGQRPDAGPDRRDGLRRHGAGQGRRSTPTSQGDEKPLVWEELEAEENLDGLSDEQQATFRERAVPVPGGVLRGTVRAHERRPPRHPEHAHLHRLHRRGLQSSTRPSSRLVVARRHPRAPQRRPGSTCRPATGRCGRSPPRSPRSSATWPRRQSPRLTRRAPRPDDGASGEAARRRSTTSTAIASGSDDPGSAPATPAEPTRSWWLLLLVLPLIGLALLLAQPQLDLHWEHQPSHFWLVLASAVAQRGPRLPHQRRRRPPPRRAGAPRLARVPRQRRLPRRCTRSRRPACCSHHPNTGFAIATPVGLTIAAVFAATSRSSPLGGPRAMAVLRWRQLAARRRARCSMLGLGRRLARRAAAARRSAARRARARAARRAGDRRRSRSTAGRRGARWSCTTTAAAPCRSRSPSGSSCSPRRCVAVAVSRNWHLSWWEWHLLMLAAFVAIALGARREYASSGSLTGGVRRAVPRGDAGQDRPLARPRDRPGAAARGPRRRPRTWSSTGCVGEGASDATSSG